MIGKIERKTLYFKLCVYFSTLIVSICLATIGVIYVGFYYNFENHFEDTILEANVDGNEDVKFKDEWIIGVNAHNLTLVEAIHGEEIANHLYETAKYQNESSKVYEAEIDGKQLMYKIDISEESGENIYTYSVIRNIYKEILPNVVISIIIFAIIIIIIAIFIVRAMCKHLVKDINKISEHANKIAYEDWEEPIDVSAKSEELISLVNSFEYMREQLKERDEMKQYMIEYISHELKTPIMIISSYTQAIRDDIFPVGDLNSSLDIVLEQTDRMNNKVEDLLFIAKLTNDKGDINVQTINLSRLIYRIINNFKFVRKLREDIHININIDTTLNIVGDREKLDVLFENLIDNQLRYANRKVIIRAISKGNKINILFFNDGETMSISNSEDIFKPFIKGENGKSGLGLAICKRTAEVYKGDLIYIPTKIGCLFKLTLVKSI